VPQESLVGAGYPDSSKRRESRVGARENFTSGEIGRWFMAVDEEKGFHLRGRKR